MGSFYQFWESGVCSQSPLCSMGQLPFPPRVVLSIQEEHFRKAEGTAPGMEEVLHIWESVASVPSTHLPYAHLHHPSTPLCYYCCNYTVLAFVATFISLSPHLSECTPRKTSCWPLTTP